MKVIIISFIAFFFLTPLAATNTMRREVLIQQRIERVINGLLPETPLENQYGAPASLKDRMAHYHTPGVSIAIINNYQLEWAGGFGVMEYGKNGPVTKRTLFQAASISKPVFATAVMGLLQEGRLSLDEDVNTYLVSWNVPKNGEWQPRITLRQLLSHSAGIGENQGFAGYLRSQKLPSIIEILNGIPPANNRPVVVTMIPGLQMRYSGGGTTIAQQVIVEVLKKPFPTIMNEMVLAPLNMKDSTFEQPLPKEFENRAATAHFQNNIPVIGKWHVYPEMAAAGLFTTPFDLAQWGIELMRSLNGEPSKLISKETIQQMLSPGVSQNMGLGFFLRGSGNNTRFEHTGANEGFRAAAIFYKNHGLGAVIMINSSANDLPFELARAIAKVYAWPGYFEEAKKPVILSPKALRGLAGIYFTQTGTTLKAFLMNEKIFLRPENQEPIELIPESDNTFYMRALNSRVTFEKNELIIKQGGQEIKAQRKR